MEKDKLIYELILDRIVKLEKRVEELEKKVTKTNKEGINIEALVTEINLRIKDNESCTFTSEEITTITGLDYTQNWKEAYSIIEKRLTNASKGKYFVHDGYQSEITFAIRPESKIGINEIRLALKSMLENSNEEYIEVCAKDFHNSMKLVSRMPTVCTAMLEIFDEGTDKILDGNKFTSKLRIVYKKR